MAVQLAALRAANMKDAENVALLSLDAIDTLVSGTPDFVNRSAKALDLSSQQVFFFVPGDESFE